MSLVLRLLPKPIDNVSISPDSPVRTSIPLPLNSTVTSVTVSVLQPFQGSPSLRVSTGLPIAEPFEIDLHTVGQYNFPEIVPASDTIQLDFYNGGSGAGLATVNFSVG